MDVDKSAEILRKFALLPARFQGRTLCVRLEIGFFESATVDECDSLRFPLGNTIRARATLLLPSKSGHGDTDQPEWSVECTEFPVFACNKVAEQLIALSLPLDGQSVGSIQWSTLKTVNAKVRTVFGHGWKIEETDNERWREPLMTMGLEILQFDNVQTKAE